MSITVPSTCFLFVVIIYTKIMTTEELITCEAGTFVVGKPASITCKFRTNITATQRAINMALYPPDAPHQAIGKDILLCRWVTEQQHHQCYLEENNYTFDHVLTDRLTVKLPAVRFEQAGHYMCFYVPSDDTDAHPCELTVVKGESDSGEAQEDLPTLLAIIIPTCVIAFVVVCIVVFICQRKRRMQRRGDDESAQPMIPIKGLTIEEHLGAFHLTNSKLQEVTRNITQEMEKGLNDSTSLEADIKIFSTFVTHLPENGNALVLDLDSKRLQVSHVKLRGHHAKAKKEQYELPTKKKDDATKELFHFIADRTNKFVKSIEIESDTLPLVLLVAFPCDTARLAKGTKGTLLESPVDTELRSLLDEALIERTKAKRLIPRQFCNLTKLKTVAVVNNSAATLMSVAPSATNCRICLTVGSELNACYWTSLETDSPKDEKPREMIVSTELGTLGEKGCLESCRTQYDKDLDEQSSSPGTQILEKMVSGRYIGELVILTLEALTRRSVLFHKVPLTCALFQKSSLSSEDVIKIEKDNEEPHQETREVQDKQDKEKPHQKTRGILDHLGVKNYTDQDVKGVRLVCKYLCERAAFLSAASLAALINHVKQPEVIVVVDGYLYKTHPRFHDLLYSKTLQCVRAGLKFYLVSPFQQRLLGAARIAVASLRHQHRTLWKAEIVHRNTQKNTHKNAQRPKPAFQMQNELRV